MPTRQQRRATYQGYYSTSEVRKRLGITNGALYNLVEKGILTRCYPPGRSQAFYARDQVDQFAREQEIFIESQRSAPVVFAQATREDMLDCAKLVEDVFGALPNIERRTAWLERNPEVCYVIRSESKVAGCAFLLPLRPEKIADILQHEETPPILPGEILPYHPDLPVHLYVMSVGVRREFNRYEKRYHGAKLIAGLIRVMVDLGRKGIQIVSITARSETPDGIRLMRHMGFTEISSVTNSRNFVIVIEQSGIDAILDYKEALREARKR